MKNIQAEREFHDNRLEKEDGLNRLSFVYKSVSDVLDVPCRPINARFESVLEIGCFNGSNCENFHCEYVGIDISPKAIDHARIHYESESRHFKVIDAHDLAGLGVKFDYVFGNGIVHHCDVARLSASLFDVLRPGGKICFIEPMAGPPWLRLFRTLSPGIRTDDEEPLSPSVIAEFNDNFNVALDFHAVFRPLIPMLFGNAEFSINLAARMDNAIKRYFPRMFAKLAWLVVIELTPRADK